MSASKSDNSTRDERVNQIIADYLKSVAEGATPNRAVLLAQHADLAEDLAAFFSDHDRFQRVAVPLAEALTLQLPAVDQVEPVAGNRVRYFGDYEILEEIARGGMGVVYKARQTTLKRIVALKMILSGQLAGEDEVKRFYVEAEAAAKLDHPNIVPIFEIGQHNGQHYFSMAFVDGESLAHKIVAGPWLPHAAAELVKKLAGAVAYAHVEGVIHRDLKPANVLIDCAGEPHVTDFGLAKRLYPEKSAESGGTFAASLTATGQVLGTPSYMPPEQAGGKTENVGPQSDVYSLGAILYCLLTGRPPFQAASAMETLMQVLQQEPVSPRLLNSKVPRDMETICLKCLEKEPRKRYAGTQSLADDLSRFLRHEPVTARPISFWGRTLKWARRRPVAAAFLAATTTAVLSLGALITGAYYNLRLEQSLVETETAKSKVEETLLESEVARRDAETAREKSEYARKLAETSRKESEYQRQMAEIAKVQSLKAKHMAETASKSEASARQAAQAALQKADVYRYLFGVGLAHSEWRSGNVRRMELLLDDCPEQHRNWEWNYLKRLCHTDLLTFRGHATSVNCVTFSPDGAKVASGSGDKTIKIWDPKSGEVALTFEGNRCPITTLAFSPDGKRVVSGCAEGAESSQPVGELKIWEVTTGRELLNLTGHTGTVLSAAFSPDGLRVAAASTDKTIRVWDAATGNEILKLTDHGVFPWLTCVAFSPDGTWLASASASDVTVWDAESGEKKRVLDGHDSFVNCVAFSADSSRILSGDGNGVVKVWDVMTGNEVVTLRGHNRNVASVAFSHDGMRLVSAGSDASVDVWDVASGLQKLQLKGHVSAVTSVQFSPDDARLVSGSADGTAKIWDAAREQDSQTISDVNAQRELRFENAPATQIPLTFMFGGVFSPQGDRIAWIGHFGMSVHVTSVASSVVTILKGHSSAIYCMAFDPSGSRISTGSADKTVRIWDVTSGKELQTLTGHAREINGVAFAPDGKQLASLSFDEGIRVWDTASGRQIAEIGGGKAFPHSISLAFGANGQLASADHRGIVLWDASTGQEKLSINNAPGPVSALAFSADGKRLAGLGGKITIWDTASGAEIIALKESGGETNAPHNGPRVAFNPDGTRLAAMFMDQTVKVWDVATGELVVTFLRDRNLDDGRTAPTVQERRTSSTVALVQKGVGGSVAFSSDGNRLFAGFGTTTQIWDGTPISIQKAE